MSSLRLGPSVRNGDRVQGDARPGELISYQISPEEIVAKYGPPVEPKKPVIRAGLWGRREGGKKMNDKRPAGLVGRAPATINQDFENEVQQMVKQNQKPGTKVCNSCGEEKPQHEFRKGHGKCKKCESDLARERYQRRKAKEEHGAAAEVQPVFIGEERYTAENENMSMDITGTGLMVLGSLAVVLENMENDKRYTLKLSLEEV